MRLGPTRWLLVGSLCVVLWHIAAASAQVTRWDSTMADAAKAYQKSDYVEAEKLLLAAFKGAEKSGEQVLRLATSLNNLATLYRTQGKNAQAEPLYPRALAIWEKTLRPEDPRCGHRSRELRYPTYAKWDGRPRLKNWTAAPRPSTPSTRKRTHRISASNPSSAA